jgi:hypothetical protein
MAMATAPYADCELYFPKHPENALDVSADGRGVVWFEVGSLQQTMVLDCKDSSGTKLPEQNVDRRAVFDSIKQSSPATAEALALPIPGTVRPALANPSSASVGDLLRGGFPIRPDATSDPDTYSRWLATVSTPAVQVKTHPRPSRIPAAGTNEPSPTWSGIVLDQPGVVYDVAFASWVQPSIIHLIDSTNAGFQDASFWIGLDGFSATGVITSNDVHQAGTFAEMDITSFDPPYCNVYRCYAATYWAFVERFPDPTWPTNQHLAGFTVRAGDLISAQVYIGDFSQNPDPNGGFLWYQVNNLTLNTVTAGCWGPAGCFRISFTNPPFNGVEAEGVIEMGGNPVPELPDYSSMQMTNFGAMTTSYVRHGFNGDSFLRVKMTGNAGDLSVAQEVAGTNNINFSWKGFQ